MWGGRDVIEHRTRAADVDETENDRVFTNKERPRNEKGAIR